MEEQFERNQIAIEFIIQNSNVKMQLRRNISANIQNLPLRKKTLAQPPPSSNSSICSSRNTQQSNEDLLYNKENINSHKDISQAAVQISARNNGDKTKTSPMLTFQKVKKNLTLQEGARKTAIQADNSRHNLSRNAPINQQSINSSSHLKTSNSYSNMLQSGHKNGVRLGSMVFSGSVAKRDQSQTRYNPSQSKQNRSIERTCSLKPERKELGQIECMNSDGRPAKYKVIKMDQDDQILHYCFNCAVPLINQGFTLQELTEEDLIQLQNFSVISNSFSHKHKRPTSKNISTSSRLKPGEQIKCKIIMKLNRLKVEREAFSKAIQSQLQSIDFFYDSLAAYIEQRRMSDKQQVMRMRSLRKVEPQNYESQLGSALGTVDYMLKNLHGVNQDYFSEVERIVQYNVCYPKLPEVNSGFQNKIDQFVHFLDSSLRITFEEQDSIESRRIVQTQESFSHNHPKRYSFEEALDQSRRNRTFIHRNQFSEMNPLQQQNESELEESRVIADRRQTAFRNLFPSESQSLASSEKAGKLSPVFKQF